MHKKTTRYVVSLGLFVVALAWSSVSRASYYGPSGTTFPPLDGVYVSPDQWFAYYAQGIYIADATLWGFTASYSLPTGGGTEVVTFGSRIDGLLSFDGMMTYFPFDAPGQMTVGIHDEGGGTYSTEMLGWAVWGGSLPTGVMIRESPTLASTGITTYTEVGVGLYRIDSFFDVFTELSLDGGMNWGPDLDGSVHIVLTNIPEPSSSMLAGLGLLGLLAYVRRCHK